MYNKFTYIYTGVFFFFFEREPVVKYLQAHHCLKLTITCICIEFKSRACIKADISTLTAAPIRILRSSGAKIIRKRMRNEIHRTCSKINVLKEDGMDTF
jgi:hypothetical protein